MILLHRTISYEASVTIAGIKPIDLKIKELLNINKIKNSNCAKVEGPLSDSLEREISCSQRPHPAMALNITFINGENLNIKYDYKIFTDGSKVDSNVGSAFCR